MNNEKHATSQDEICRIEEELAGLEEEVLDEQLRKEEQRNEDNRQEMENDARDKLEEILERIEKAASAGSARVMTNWSMDGEHDVILWASQEDYDNDVHGAELAIERWTVSYEHFDEINKLVEKLGLDADGVKTTP